MLELAIKPCKPRQIDTKLDTRTLLKPSKVQLFLPSIKGFNMVFWTIPFKFSWNFGLFWCKLNFFAWWPFFHYLPGDHCVSFDWHPHLAICTAGGRSQNISFESSKLKCSSDKINSWSCKCSNLLGLNFVEIKEILHKNVFYS